MTRNGFRFGVLGAVCLSVLLAHQPASAQTATAQGWPGNASTPVAPAAKPAQKQTSAPPRVRVSAKTASLTVKPSVVEVKLASAPAAEPIASLAAIATLPELFQRQSEILARLGAELEKQRALIAEQQQQIEALESGRAVLAVLPSTPFTFKAAPPPPAPALPPLTVETGGIKLKLSGLFQGWYTATSGPAVDSFRLRRTELKFSGDMSSRVKWALMFDAAKALSLSTSSAMVGGQQVLIGSSIGQSGRVLQDAFASLVVSPSLTIDLGQQKLPLSMEGVQSSGKLETIERALFMSDKARGGGYGDVRDLGLMVRGKLARGHLDYFAGVFNGLGESQNDQDKNDQKDLAVRLLARPTFVKGLQVGGSFARDGFKRLSQAGRERHGVELLYARGALGLKSEVMFGRDGAVPRRGGYVQATQRLNRNLQAIFRFDTWDPDSRTNAAADTVAERDWLSGVTYTIANSGAWLQLNYVRKTFADVAPARNLFIANIQSTW